MNIGELRHKVALQVRTLAQDVTGHEESTYETFAYVWAKVEEIGGVETTNQTNQVQSVVTTKFTIRYRNDINTTNRILYSGLYYEIVSALDPTGRRVMLEISTRLSEENDGG